MKSSRVLLRTIVATLLVVGLVPLAASAAMSAPGMIDISAKALTDHDCDSSEWHFVITQIDERRNPPASISVTWAGGGPDAVSLTKVTGGTAHYATTSRLDSTVASATAAIYAAWSGQFNLSHGPCGNGGGEPADAKGPDKEPKDAKGPDKEPKDAKGQKNADDPKDAAKHAAEHKLPASQPNAAKGHVPVNVCHATGSPTNPYVFITVDDDSTKLKGHLMHRNDPRHNTPADLIGDYTDGNGVRHTYDGVINDEADCVKPGKEPVKEPVKSPGKDPVKNPGKGHVPVNVCHATGSPTNPYVFITVDDDSTKLKGHLMHRNDPRHNTPADLIGDYTDGNGVFHKYDGVINKKADCVKPTPSKTVAAVSPTFENSTCPPGATGSSRTASYTIPATTGVDYYAGETKVATGKVSVLDGVSVVITARAQRGYVLAAPLSVSHTFAVPVCPSAITPATPAGVATSVTPVTPAAPAETAIAATPVTEAAPTAPTAVLGVKKGANAAPKATPAAAVRGVLARTGGQLPLGLALAASALLVLGGAFLMAMSRRRSGGGAA